MLGLVDVFIALFLGGLAVTLSSYLVWRLIQPALVLLRTNKKKPSSLASPVSDRGLFSTVRGSLSMLKLKKASRRLFAADALIEQREFLKAVYALKKAVVFDHSGDMNFLSAVRDHHQSLLSRCLVVAEESKGRPENLAVVERLFLERGKLHAKYSEALASFEKLSSKRRQSGKDLPKWTKADYRQRLSQTEAELEKNQKELEKSLDQLFSSILSSPQKGVVYH